MLDIWVKEANIRDIRSCVGIDLASITAISSAVRRVLEMLEGKGAGKNGRFQGKANSLARLGEVEAVLQQRCQLLASGEE